MSVSSVVERVVECFAKFISHQWDPKTEGKIADPQERHKDKVLDKFCDDHPGSPMCKVFDE